MPILQCPANHIPLNDLSLYSCHMPIAMIPMSLRLKVMKNYAPTQIYHSMEHCLWSSHGNLVPKIWQKLRRMSGHLGWDLSSQFIILLKLGRLCKLGLRISSLGVLATAIQDLDNYMMLEKAAPKKSAKKDPYDRTALWSYCENRKATFQKFYIFCFALAKPEWVQVAFRLTYVSSDADVGIKTFKKHWHGGTHATALIF